ncbi:hypothetical protein [Actinocrispum wychmicini]|uniref:Excreted virulence factor EspC (Type VII ESX diderm) n=1 Tax=Actinocrispum wychmicini TaxID=1213861 RepID=A0A4R2IYS7_9PSEU|nr:hypothetical protein [Actinocrispum wychmicini]TCO50714.1 hypothetical protein EV192_11392 [Actinocrispum wychmicini]
MDGYGLSIDEVRTTCRKVAGEVDDISRQADVVRRSEVVSSDFGVGTDIGASYVEVTHGVLADSLSAFGTASEGVIRKLLDTFAEYQRVDEDNSGLFRSDL